MDLKYIFGFEIRFVDLKMFCGFQKYIFGFEYNIFGFKTFIEISDCPCSASVGLSEHSSNAAMATKEDGVICKAYRDDTIIAICRPEKKENTGKPQKPRLGYYRWPE